jgi:hypothetical protein
MPEVSEIRARRADDRSLADVDEIPQKRRRATLEDDGRHVPASADLSCVPLRGKVNPDRSNDMYDAEIHRTRGIIDFAIGLQRLALSPFEDLPFVSERYDVRFPHGDVSHPAVTQFQR